MNLIATAPFFFQRASVALTMFARYSASVGGGRVKPTSLSSELMVSVPPEYPSQLASPANGRSSGSAYGTQRKRPLSWPAPGATVFSNAMSTPAVSSTALGQLLPAFSMVSRLVASSPRTCASSASANP